MSDLQAKIEDFIYRWQPGESLIYAIPPEAPASEIYDAAVSVDYIIDSGIDHDKGFLWFELDSRLMENQYRNRQELWKQENEIANEEYYYGRRAI